MVKKTFCIISILAMALWAFGQAVTLYTQSLQIQNQDDNVKLMLICGNQNTHWLACSDGTNEVFGITGKGSLITTKTNTGGNITATGWTNNTGSDVVVVVLGNNITFSNYDGKGNLYMTNTTLNAAPLTLFLQKNAFFTAASGLSGVYHSF